MKIKIVEPGYEGFTGMFGVVEFVDAVSVHDVSSAEINLLSSILRIVDAETDAETGKLAQEAFAMDKPAVVEYFPTLADLAAGVTHGQAKSEAPVVQAKTYTQKELEVIADKKGIAGLREIADPMGLKGTSIGKLIQSILDHQSGVAFEEPTKEAAEVAEVVETAEGVEGE